MEEDVNVLGDNSEYIPEEGSPSEILNTDAVKVKAEVNEVVFNESCFSTDAKTYANEYLTTTYVGKLFDAIFGLESTGAKTFWDQVVKIANSYQDGVEEIDLPDRAGAVARSGGTGGRSGGGSSGGDYDSDYPDATLPDIDIPEVVVPDLSTATVPSITTRDLRTVSEGLLSMSDSLNLDVEGLLTDSGLAGQLKDSLLGLPLSPEFLDLATQMDAEDLRQFLNGLYNGTNSDMVTVTEPLMSYLEYLKQNGNLENILTDANNADFLKNGLGAFQSVNQFLIVSDGNDFNQIKLNLLYIDNGYTQNFNLDENAVEIFRTFNAQMAQEKNVSVEELFTNSQYDSYVQSKIEDLRNTSAYLAALSDTSSANAQKALNSVISK